MAKSDDDRDGRSSMARGHVIAAHVTSIGMQMAIPPAIGWWVDSQFKTKPLLLILGAVLGLVIAMLELMRFAKDNDSSNS